MQTVLPSTEVLFNEKLSVMDSFIASKFNRPLIAQVCAVTTIVVSMIVIVGWFLNIDVLKSVIPGFPQMKPNTSVACVLMSIGLYCSASVGRSELYRNLALLCGASVLVIGTITLGEYLAGSNIGVDTALFSASNFSAAEKYPGRMSPQSAFNFFLVGLSLITLNGSRFWRKVSEFIVGIVIVTTFAAILGHLYGAVQLYGVSNYNSMAIHTAGIFLISSLGLLAANYNSRTIHLLLSDDLGGQVARRLLPAIIVIPTFVGWLRMLGQERGLFDTGFGSAMTIFVCVLLMCAVVLFISETIHKADSRRREAEQDLAEKEQRYRDLFEHGQNMICIHDLDGRLSAVNPAALMSLGYEADEVVGKSLREFMPQELQPQFPNFLRQIENEGLASGTFALVAKNGSQVIWQYHSILVLEPGKEPYVLGNAQDITKFVEATNELKGLTLTDDLTGLYNRRGFQTLVEQQIRLESHEGTARGLTMMFADLDGLKKINDRYGHDAGSAAIIAFGNVLKAALRGADVIARWGGDEFVILTIGSPGETSEMIVDRILARLNLHNIESETPYDLACSIGVTTVPRDGTKSFDELIAEADKAMYEEKRRRKAALLQEAD